MCTIDSRGYEKISTKPIATYENFREKMIDLFQEYDKSVLKEKHRRHKMTKEQDKVQENSLNHISKVVNNPNPNKFTNDWTKKIEALEARVKELEGENKARREMWEELKEEYLPMEEEHDESDYVFMIVEGVKELEQKYLGGKS